MKFTQETDYALRLVDAFSAMPPGERRASREMAERERIPFRFLLRVIGKLKKAKILASRRGPAGGYCLARPPESITLLQVIEAIEGTMRFARCLENPALCNAGRAPYCRIHRALFEIQAELARNLGSRTFAGPEAPVPGGTGTAPEGSTGAIQPPAPGKRP